MKKMSSAFVTLGLVIVLILVLAPAATAASGRTAVSGTWTWENTLWDAMDLPTGGQVGYGEEIGVWTGAFAGSSFDTFNGVYQPQGGGGELFVGTLWIHFDGKVNGVSGKMLMRVTFKGGGPVPGMDGQWTIVKGWDGLGGLSGSGTWYIREEGPAHHTGMVRM